MNPQVPSVNCFEHLNNHRLSTTVNGHITDPNFISKNPEENINYELIQNSQSHTANKHIKKATATKKYNIHAITCT